MDEPPQSLEDAERRRVHLIAEVQRLQGQLGDRQRTDRSGQRLSSQEYFNWKKRATYALNQCLDELRNVKAWISEHRQSSTTASHLEKCVKLLVDMKNDGVEFDQLDDLILRDAQAHLLALNL